MCFAIDAQIEAAMRTRREAVERRRAEIATQPEWPEGLYKTFTDDMVLDGVLNDSSKSVLFGDEPSTQATDGYTIQTLPIRQ